MHIASRLRRKRDEIAATIAAYEARIDAARRDLAALDQAARLNALVPVKQSCIARAINIVERLSSAFPSARLA